MMAIIQGKLVTQKGHLQNSENTPFNDKEIFFAVFKIFYIINIIAYWTITELWRLILRINYTLIKKL
jgi:hypothetical protein